MPHQIRFETHGWLDRPPHERLEAAIARIEAMNGFASVTGSIHTLRDDQVDVFKDILTYLRISAKRQQPYGRIILPPRTGKTVIAGQLIRATQLTTTYLVPTRALADQVARELETQLPGTLIALYYSGHEELTDHGVIVMTYASFQSLFKRGILPEQVRRSGLVIADEAHHSMTAGRLIALANAFHRQVPRIALTASPDYSEQRQLATYYPILIHQVTFDEAHRLGLIAPSQTYIHEVDIDASQVTVVGDDFSEEVGSLLSKGLVFDLTRKLRYDDPANRARGCLIACRSRAQARALHRYLAERRPADAPEPGLVLGDTPNHVRLTLERGFNDGTTDTLIQVGVLIEGWNAPRCKLLIDLAPTPSMVRATQKFFRPPTLCGEEKAEIRLILPKNLQKPPILPEDVKAQDAKEPSPELPVPPNARRPVTGTRPRISGPIAAVPATARLLSQTSAETARLLRHDQDALRSILASNPSFDPSNPPPLEMFRHLSFHHALFRGTGTYLLRALKVSPKPRAYRGWLIRLYLKQVPTHDLRGFHEHAEHASCADDADVVRELARRFDASKCRDTGLEDAWRTLFGQDEEAEWEPIEDRLDKRRALARLEQILRSWFLPREQNLLLAVYDLGPWGHLTVAQISQQDNLSESRIYGVNKRTIERIRQEWGRFPNPFQR